MTNGRKVMAIAHILIVYHRNFCNKTGKKTF